MRFIKAKWCAEARPNACHRALAALEERGIVKAVITQNIDGLHQAAGSKNVLELHGSVLRNRCMRCKKPFPLEAVMAAKGAPRCACGGLVKPEVVLYEEPLDPDVTYRACARSRTSSHHRRHLAPVTRRLLCVFVLRKNRHHQQIPHHDGPQGGSADHAAHRRGFRRGDEADGPGALAPTDHKTRSLRSGAVLKLRSAAAIDARALRRASA